MGDTELPTGRVGGGAPGNPVLECGRFLVDQRPSLEVIKWKATTGEYDK